MASKEEKPKKTLAISQDWTQVRLGKCPFCTGQDGKKKDIYETPQLAFDTAKHIEEERGIFLNVYSCPHNNGWHLTKNNATSGIIERQETIFQNNGIPTESPDHRVFSWEYVKAEEFMHPVNSPKNKRYEKDEKAIPIIKIKCPSDRVDLSVSGKVMEMIAPINIEKYFSINLDNPIGAHIAKIFLVDTVSQITLYVKNSEKNKTESYTILIPNALLKQNRIMKNDYVSVNIKGKSINHSTVWYGYRIHGQAGNQSGQ